MPETSNITDSGFEDSFLDMKNATIGMIIAGPPKAIPRIL